MRRACAAVLLAILTLVSGTPITCAGWEASGSDRMACCKRAAHDHCDDQAMADSCCAGQEQTHQSGPTASAAMPIGPAVLSAVLPGLLEFAAAAWGRRVCSFNVYRFHDPPGLLSPPLRI